MYSGLYYVCTSFGPYYRSLCVDIFLFKSQMTTAQTQAHTHTHANTPMLLGACRCSRSPPRHLNVVHLKLVWPTLSSSPYFPLQMTASTREMSGSLCQRYLASSNICEVLSSSPQLSRAVSQESRLLTRNTAKTA